MKKLEQLRDSLPITLTTAGDTEYMPIRPTKNKDRQKQCPLSLLVFNEKTSLGSTAYDSLL
jgi:hypothetical protein